MSAVPTQAPVCCVRIDIRCRKHRATYECNQQASIKCPFREILETNCSSRHNTSTCLHGWKSIVGHFNRPIHSLISLFQLLASVSQPLLNETNCTAYNCNGGARLTSLNRFNFIVQFQSLHHPVNIQSSAKWLTAQRVS